MSTNIFPADEIRKWMDNAAMDYYADTALHSAMRVAVDALENHSCCPACEPCPGCMNFKALAQIAGMLWGKG